MTFLRMFTPKSSMVLLVALLCIGWMPVMADAPTPWQMGFQDPATAAMEGYRIVFGFHHTLQPQPERFNHHTNLELVWALLPSLVVTLIALPSLTLIYTFDDLVARPALTVKVIGRQWYWSYEMKEHVHHTLTHPMKLLEASNSLEII